ncbi:hypothetical protein J6590_053314 [Homalodisca vitripennis]|nr:hypothetical protein J6590_053314 [Homalodisca vitripennis]
MYTTCVIWLAFVPLYFGTGNNMALRITSMSVTISLSASVTVACLFSPKLYIILIRPERNVRQSMMPTQRPVSAAPTVTSLSRVPHTATEVTLVSKLTESRAKEDNNQTRIDPLLTTSRATQTEVSSEISEPNGPQM